MTKDALMKEYEKQAQILVNELDSRYLKFSFQAKLNGMGNSWIYQQIKASIESNVPDPAKDFALQWLDSRLGEYKPY